MARHQLGLCVAAWASVVSFGSGSPARAAPPGDGPWVDNLDPATTYHIGCYPPCKCPILAASGVSGTFVLTLTQRGPLFDTYTVTNVDWTVQLGEREAHLTGGGTYLFGGEVANTQELNLDLSTDGQPPEHFHSGRVIAHERPPAIDVVVSINDMYCFDTVIHIVALPGCAADFNHSGAVDSQDFFDFLAAFFASAPSADFNHSGAIDSQDFFDFLTAFFAGC